VEHLEERTPELPRGGTLKILAVKSCFHRVSLIIIIIIIIIIIVIIIYCGISKCKLITISTNKPDITICDNERGACMLIDVVISGDRNVIKKEDERRF
jgi:hypothetical protein